MTTIAVLHAFYDILGGGEKLSLTLTKALVEAGYDVDVITATPVDYNRMKSLFGYSLKDLGVHVIVDKDIGVEKLRETFRVRFVRLRRLIAYKRFFEKYIDGNKDYYDILIDTQSNAMSGADICYIHFPAIIEYDVDRSGIHWKLYNMLVKHYADKYFRRYVGRVVTNSTWTASMIYKAYHVLADTVYPPVDVETYMNYCMEKGCPHDEKAVVTVSRYTPEKNMERIIDLARLMPDYTFYIIGSTNKYSRPVIALMRKRMADLGVDNVKLMVNVPLEKKLEILARARYYLHPPFPEHFGIAVVEAMATGLVPIVYRDGGAYYDIVRRVDDRLSYVNMANVLDIIKTIDYNKQLYDTLSARSIETAKQFNYERFKKNMLDIVRRIEEVKLL